MSRKQKGLNSVSNNGSDEGYVTHSASDANSAKPAGKFKKFIEKIGKKRLKVIGITLGSIILAFTIFFTVLHFVSAPWRSGDKPMPKFFANLGFYQGSNFRYFDGITINGVDVGGMTKNQARNAVNEAQDDDKSQYAITITAGEKSYELKGKDIAFTVDSTAALDEAKAFCVSVMHGENVKQKKNYNARVVIDEKKMANVLTTIQNELRQDPVNATFKGVNSSGIQFEKEKEGINITTENLVADIESFLSNGNKKGTIVATNEPSIPEITVETLSEKIQLIGTFSTTSTASANSTFNMRKAMGLCDGSVIEPGAVWSFNACTGNSNLPSAGWKSAKVISGGQFTEGYGGGICQASTTIYNAALRANLAIDTRYNHTYPSTYCKVGFDATVDYPSKDLKLKNNTKYPVYIQCIMEGKKLTVNIYGCPDNTFDEITFESRTSNRVPGSHYDVVAFRILWKDGKQIKREQLISSRYSLKSSTPSSSENSSGDNSSDNNSSDNNSSDNNSSDNNSSDNNSSGGNSSGGDNPGIVPDPNPTLTPEPNPEPTPSAPASGGEELQSAA